MKAMRANIFAIVFFYFVATVFSARFTNVKRIDLETWKPSDEMKRDLPAYKMGFDYDERPVYVVELGKWNVLKYLLNSNETATEMMYRRSGILWNGLLNLTTHETSSAGGAFVIFDMAGFNHRVLLFPEAIRFQFWNMAIMERMDEYIEECFIINSSFAVNIWIKLLKPLVGKVLRRAVTINMDARKVIASLRQKIPRDQLPSYYGGYRNYTPAAIL